MRPPTSTRRLVLAALLAAACGRVPAPQTPHAAAHVAPVARDEPARLTDAPGWADAYVLALRPTAAAYRPAPGHGFSRSGGPITVTKPTGTTGRYLVRFPGLSAALGPGSTVHVAGRGRGTPSCKPARAQLVRDTIEVRCVDPTGSAVDARFTALVVRPAAHLAYAWADRPSAASYTPRAHYGSNPSGGTILVIRNAVGQYTVTWAGVGSALIDYGRVQVTADGGGGVRCRATGAHHDGAVVQCTDADGRPADGRYTVLLHS